MSAQNRAMFADGTCLEMSSVSEIQQSPQLCRVQEDSIR